MHKRANHPMLSKALGIDKQVQAINDNTQSVRDVAGTGLGGYLGGLSGSIIANNMSKGPKKPLHMLLGLLAGGGLGAGAGFGLSRLTPVNKAANMDGQNAMATYDAGQSMGSVPVTGPQTASVGVDGIGGALGDLGGPLLGKTAAAAFNKMSKEAQVRVLTHPDNDMLVKIALVRQMPGLTKQAKVKLVKHLFTKLSAEEKRAFGALARGLGGAMRNMGAMAKGLGQGFSDFNKLRGIAGGAGSMSQKMRGAAQLGAGLMGPSGAQRGAQAGMRARQSIGSLFGAPKPPVGTVSQAMKAPGSLSRNLSVGTHGASASQYLKGQGVGGMGSPVIPLDDVASGFSKTMKSAPTMPSVKPQPSPGTAPTEIFKPNAPTVGGKAPTPQAPSPMYDPENVIDDDMMNAQMQGLMRG